MLLEEIKSIKSGRKELKSFGIVIAVALAILGGLLFWKEKGSYPYFLVGSGAFLLCGLLLPTVLKPFHKVWMALAVVLGWIMTRVILTVLYYLMMTPIGLCGRLFGKAFLDVQ